MNALLLLLAEIAYRPLNFLLCLAAIAVAATLFVAGPLMLDSYVRTTQAQLDEVDEETGKTLAELDKQTKRIMRDIGLNLRLVHKDTNFGDLFFDYKAVDFPQSDVDLLAKAKDISTIVHVVASVNERLIWNDKPVLLVGVLPILTDSQKNEEKPHMVKHVERGTVHVGHQLGEGLKVGGTLTIKDREFTIASIQPSRGTRDDQQLLVHLEDAQEMLGLEGRIHQMLALSCKCKGERVGKILKQLETVLPHLKVTEMEARATAREKQRDLVTAKRDEQLALIKSNREASESSLRKLVTLVSPLVVGVCGLFVGLLTWLNVRERRSEIGVLRAIGRGGGSIALMILGKAALIGLLGGVLGCCLGIWAASGIAEGLSAEAVQPNRDRLLLMTTLGAPLIAVIASYLPMLAALMQDPSVVLSDG